MALLSTLPTFTKKTLISKFINSYTEEVGKQFPSITEATTAQFS
jgi:hypothetical protein